MIVGTWNIRGFQRSKYRKIDELIDETDVLCLTETLGPISHHEYWNSFDCNLQRDDRRSGPGRSGGSLLPTHNPFIHRESKATASYQNIAGRV